MRLALVAAIAAVAGAHDAAAALAGAPVATGEVSWAEAQCMLRKRRIAFLGDSNSRFHWMTFNWFLETGKLRVPRGSRYDKRGHSGPPDYDEGYRGRVWTDDYRSEKYQDVVHRQGLSRAAASCLRSARRMCATRPRASTSTGTASGSASTRQASRRSRPSATE